MTVGAPAARGADPEDATGGSGQRVRVGLRIPAGPVPAWLAATVGNVLAVPSATLTVVVHGPPAAARGPGRLERGYEAAERRALRGSAPALLPVPPVDLAPGVPVVPAGDPRAQARAIAELADVLIDLVPDDGIDGLPIPPLGRWRPRFRATEDDRDRPMPARPRKPQLTVASTLHILSASGTVVAEAGTSTVRRVGFSRDRDAVLWRAALLPSRALARVCRGGTPSIAEAALQPGPSPRPDAHGTARPPWVGLARTVAEKLVRRALWRSEWSVVTREISADADPPRDLQGFRPIADEPGRFYADPFIFASEEGLRILVEDCPAGSHRGRISSLARDGSGRWSMAHVEVDDLEHRAYPHVAPTPLGPVMTPDSGRDLGVDLLAWHGPGSRWAPIGRILEDRACSDPTLLWHAERYWLFVTIAEHGMNPWDELHLFSSTSLTTGWEPHPQNPVVADPGRARPAGRVLERAGRLIRPAQDCSSVYGGRIVLAEIVELTSTRYSERVIGTIEPRGMDGVSRTHTYARDGSIECLDVYRTSWRLRR